MITINIDDPERGTSPVFPDEATAIIWVQDEIMRWENALSSLAKDVNSPCVTPLRRWRDIKENIDQTRRRRDSVVEEQDYVEKDFSNRTVLLESVYGNSLLFVLRNLGSDAADFAAINARLADGEMDWTNNDAFRGAILFDSRRQLYIDFEERHGEKSRLMRLATAEKQTEHIMKSITQLDGMVSSLATVMNQQREQIEAELKTYKAEAIEGWKDISGRVRSLEIATNSALAAAETKFEAAIAKATTSVDNWTLAHNEERQLEKPAALWADRARSHLKNSEKWQRWSIGVGTIGLLLAVVIAVYAFWWARPLFHAAIIPGTAASAEAGAGTLRPTFHYELIFTGAITLAWLTMYLWAMRLLVRLYTTEHHLSIDASARGAMMEAYLGLIKADAASATDRPIVLQALFRPVQDGMVRDEGPPGITPAAMLSALATTSGKGS